MNEAAEGKERRNMVALTDRADGIANSISDFLRISKTDLIQRVLFFMEAAPSSVQQVIAGVVADDVREAYLKATGQFIADVIEGRKVIELPPVRRPGRGRKKLPGKVLGAQPMLDGGTDGAAESAPKGRKRRSA